MKTLTLYAKTSFSQRYSNQFNYPNDWNDLMGERGQKDLFNGADIVLIMRCYKNSNQSGSIRSEIECDITDLMKTLCWLIIRSLMLA